MSSKATGWFSEIDAVKGSLILLVILGHDTLVTRIFTNLFPVLYNFHVAAFLLLPAVFPSKALTGIYLADRAVRYLVPYVVFAFVTACAWRMVGPRADGLGQWAIKTGSALASGDADALKDVTGFTLFWFMPVLFSLTCLRSGLARIKGKWLRAALIVAAICVHCTCGAWPAWTRSVVPLGLTKAAFVLPMALVVGVAWPHLRGNLPFALASITIAIVTGFVVYKWHSVSNVGALDVPTVLEPLRLLVHDLHTLAATCGLLGSGQVLERIAVFGFVGRRSLPTYLIHSQVLHVYFVATAAAGISLPAVPNALLGTGFMMVATFAIASALQAPPLRNWLFPRDVRSWAATRVLARWIHHSPAAERVDGGNRAA
jgi:fucose 4-O-acetylase-like acetyltransferase